jgi:hypothetical protein
MTVFEMHLEVEQKLQEQASYQRDRILPDAIDLALRQAEEQLIKENVDIRFADRETKLKNIQPLLEKNRVKSIFIPQVADADYESDAVFTELPADMLYLLNARVEVITSTNCDANPSLGTTSYTEYITTVSFPNSSLGSAPYYTGFKLTRSGPTVFYTSPTAFANRFQDKNQKYEIISNVLDTINRPGSTLRAYWEHYNGTYAAQSFIFVNTTNDTTITLNTYASDGTTPDITTSGNSVARIRTTYNRSLIAGLTNSVVNTNVPVKEVETDLIYKMQKLNSFTKSKSYEPLAAKSANNLYVYLNEGFIVTNMLLDYIRKPRQISLILNQSCELDPSLHREVTDRAVEILKKNTQDPTLQVDAQYNNLRTRN